MLARVTAATVAAAAADLGYVSIAPLNKDVMKQLRRANKRIELARFICVEASLRLQLKDLRSELNKLDT